MKKSSLFIIFLFCLKFLDAQETKVNNNHQYELNWQSPQSIVIDNLNKEWYLSFEGAVYENVSNIPSFYLNSDVIKSNMVPKPEIINTVWEEIPFSESSIIKNSDGFIFDNIQVTSKTVYEKKKPLLSVKFIPIRKNGLTGNFERLIAFDIKYDYANADLIKLPVKSHKIASNSVLKTGDWYRFDVFRSGIHIVTYNDLVALGLDPTSIDPRNLRVYGNGAMMLPENNALFMYDDLVENAIFINGQEDGAFNSGDYILFYAKGHEYWIADTINKVYNHQKNNYTESSAYFITASLGTGKRIQTVSSLTQSADYTVTEFDDYAFHEIDSVNLIKSGREFYGELFDVSTSYTFNFSFPNVVPASIMKLRTGLLARSVGIPTSFKVFSNSLPAITAPITVCSPVYTAPYANYTLGQANVTPGSAVSIRIDYNKSGNSSAKGWLDYIEINANRYLTFVSGQLPFRNMNSLGKGVSEFIIGNTNASVIVWDITNFLEPKKIDIFQNGNNSQFKIKTDSLREFVAFDGTSYYPIFPKGKISNQNLHGLPQTDMVIVAYPDFLADAGRIADLHRNNDNLSVVVTTPQEVFNEFSSGNQDITAIKNLMRMLYDRAGGDVSKQPKFLLLFGDASYDYLNRIPENTNFVPIYQTANSLDPTNSFATDDYLGFLDVFDEGPFANLLDIAVGRLSVKSVEDANAVTNKILNYAATYDLATTDASCAENFGTISNFADWRNVVCLVADDNDEGENFLGESEAIANLINTDYPMYNVDKIFLDAFPQVSSAGGQKSQECTDAINQRVEKGALIVNYIGHGGEVGWAHEGILDVSDINDWKNKYNNPLFITATCEFSRCDDPERISAGEYVLINPNGGGVALFTTSRLAWSGSNSQLNMAFFKNVFEKVAGNFQYLGNVVSKAKNSMGCASSISNFLLLGDPALKLAFPKLAVITDSMNNHPVAGTSDTLKALQKVTFRGYVADNSGIKQTNYNGIVIPIVYDKAVTNSTLGSNGTAEQFTSQKNILFKGKVSVVNGAFSFTFVVPKDIDYTFGNGKISYYSKNENTDANGYYNDFIIGGNSNNTITDLTGPEIKLFLNDTRFVSGGITSKNPVLLAQLSDTAGLNTVGNGIGHDLSAVLDGNTDKTFALNDYYESELNTYQRGTIKYPFKNLDIGSHKLLLKAWDIYNNSAETQIDFVVAESAELALSHVLNYPNPFTTYTEFWFEHNQPCCGLDVQVQVFTITGRLVKTIMTRVETSGFRADPIPWDGKDDFGDRIGKGVYIYKLRVKSNTGLYADKTEKLVILK